MDQTTVDTYNKQAQEYDDQTKDFWEIFPKTFLNKFADSVQGEVLDIGSGPGRDGLLLQEGGLNLTCLDASEVMVKMCQNKGLKAVVGDFLNLPFADKTFDGVWAYTAWLHITKDEIDKAVQEASRVLKDNGILGLGMIEGDLDKYRETARMPLPRWFSFYRKDELENLLERNGFEIIYFEDFQPISETYKNTKTYLNFIARKK